MKYIFFIAQDHPGFTYALLWNHSECYETMGLTHAPETQLVRQAAGDLDAGGEHRLESRVISIGVLDFPCRCSLKRVLICFNLCCIPEVMQNLFSALGLFAGNNVEIIQLPWLHSGHGFGVNLHFGQTRYCTLKGLRLQNAAVGR